MQIYSVKEWLTCEEFIIKTVVFQGDGTVGLPGPPGRTGDSGDRVG